MIIVKQSHRADITITAGAVSGFNISVGKNAPVWKRTAREVKQFLNMAQHECPTGIRVFDMTERVLP